ncbi:MAG: Acetyltransferase (GNAT) family protein [Candidatus Methanolliviera sp. GoM_oil]|nr:MAG: Acetyltransferase (GNAT) family protein [Candidatus Methanolliviera sp. GoM_oil]
MSEEIISLGTSTRGKSGKIWRDVERNVARYDPNYFFMFNLNPQSSKEEIEKEFFAILVDGDYVGRASVALDKRLKIGGEGKKVGFIEDFMVREDYKDHADLLIEQCLAVLKVKGVEEVMVKGSSLPALQTEGYGEVPPYGCPYNPPWYVDLFERNGFLKTKKAANYRIKIPKISDEAKNRGEGLLEEYGWEMRKLNMRDKKELKEYTDLMKDVYMGRFLGWEMPGMNLERLSRVRLFFSSIGAYLMRNLNWCAFENGKMVFCISFHPDPNAALYNLTSGKTGFISGLKIIGLPLATRRTKRYVMGGVAVSKDLRGRGLGSGMMQWGMDLIKSSFLENMEEMDTGPTMMENMPPVQLMKALLESYDCELSYMEYVMMVRTFEEENV